MSATSGWRRSPLPDSPLTGLAEDNAFWPPLYHRNTPIFAPMGRMDNDMPPDPVATAAGQKPFPLYVVRV